MTASVQGILMSFEALSEPERYIVAAEIMRRIRTLDYPPVDDDTLVRLADELFSTLDEQEVAGGQP